MSRLLDILHSGRVLLMDGAMGTELQRAGMGEDECYELWNLRHPDRVGAVHRSYVDAGAQCLLTHTFLANPTMLAKRGLPGQWEAINEAAFRLARQAAGAERFVLADVGPYFWLGTPAGDRHAYEDFLASLQPDALLLETMSDLGELLSALRPEELSIKIVRPPLLFSLAYGRNDKGELRTCVGNSDRPETPEYFAKWANKLRIDALGVNCGREIGMDEVIEIIRRYRRVTDLPLFARPNAGTPTKVGDRWVYPRTPEQMAARLPELLEAGVNMVGGCCGTTPEHLAAFRPIIDEWNARRGFQKKV